MITLSTRGRRDRNGEGIPGMRCPHCDSRSTIRSSLTYSSTYRTATYQCINIECGFTWLCALHVLHEMSPSAMPNPSVNIPKRPAPAALSEPTS